MMDEMNELFYKDAYMKDFDGVVVSCAKGKKGYEVVLDDTAFIPKAADSRGTRGPWAMPGCLMYTGKRV